MAILIYTENHRTLFFSSHSLLPFAIVSTYNIEFMHFLKNRGRDNVGWQNFDILFIGKFSLNLTWEISENEDYVLLADLMEYDLLPTVREWQQFLQNLAKS